MEAPDFLQSKARLVRKQRHSKSVSEIGVITDLRAYFSANQRNEMENRFKTKIVPSSHLESVVINQSHPRFGVPQSSRARMMSNAILHNEKSDPKTQTFYYVDRNEMLGFGDFFQFHKELETNRKYNDKLHFEQDIEEKRRKLQQLRINSRSNGASSFNSYRRSPTATPQDLKMNILSHSMSRKSRSGVTGIRGRTHSGGTLFESNSGLPSAKETVIEPRNFEEGISHKNYSIGNKHNADSRPNELEDQTPINLEFDYLTFPERNSTSSSPHPQRIVIKFQNSISRESPRSATLKTPHNRRVVTPEKELSPSHSKFIEPKLTMKELHRQLFHHTVTPKKLKSRPQDSKREKHYITVFKDAQVMDREMGLGLQRIRKQILKENQASVPLKQVRNLSVVDANENVLHHVVNEIVEPCQSLHDLDRGSYSTRGPDQPKNDLLIAETITRNIQDINDLLKENVTIKKSKSNKGMPSKSVQSSPKRELGKESLKKLLANRIPLRKVVDERYGFNLIVKRNAELSQRVKEIKSLVVKRKKEDKGLHYLTSNFVDYYIP